MLMRLLAFCATVWRYWKTEWISVKHASVYILFCSAIFYLLGTIHTPINQQDLQDNLTNARNDVRNFAKEMTQRNGTFKNLRARDNLNENTIALLNHRIESLITENIKTKEQIGFYQQVLSDKNPTGDVVIHVLEMNPGFSSRQWRLNAVLARLSKRKNAYKGAYYFEILLGDADGGDEKTIRHPQENHPFEINFYYEIDEEIILSAAQVIQNVRLVVVNEDGDIVTSADLLKDSEEKQDEDNGDELLGVIN